MLLVINRLVTTIEDKVIDYNSYDNIAILGLKVVAFIGAVLKYRKLLFKDTKYILDNITKLCIS